MSLKYFRVSEIDHFSGLRLEVNDNVARSELNAWDLSKSKWDLLHQFCMESKLVEGGGVSTCGLCLLYFYGHEEECEDCPVKKAGYPGCANTPQKDYESEIKKGDLNHTKQAAEEEILFLKRIVNGPGL